MPSPSSSLGAGGCGCSVTPSLPISKPPMRNRPLSVSRLGELSLDELPPENSRPTASGSRASPRSAILLKSAAVLASGKLVRARRCFLRRGIVRRCSARCKINPAVSEVFSNNRCPTNAFTKQLGAVRRFATSFGFGLVGDLASSATAPLRPSQRASHAHPGGRTHL